MKHLIIILLLAFAVNEIRAQNLVLNPSFEDFGSCVNGPNDFSTPFLNYWKSPNLTTPDFYSSCSQNSFMHPATSFSGPMLPKSGNTQSGFFTALYSYDPNSNADLGKEYIEGQLSEPLVKDSLYCVKFYIALSYYRLAIAKMGVLFSDSLIKRSDELMPYTPQLESPATLFFDKGNTWMKWQQIYRAKGGEQFLTIGNFNSYNNTPKLYLQSFNSGADDSSTYHYIDDVSVEMIPSYLATLNLGKDTVLCDTTGFSATLQVPAIFDSVRWNTGANSLSISVNQIGEYDVIAYYGECEIKDTIRFELFNPVAYPILSDTSLCEPFAPITISLTPSFDQYLWSTGNTSPSVSLINTGSYVVTMSNRCQTYIDSFDLVIKPTPPLPTVSDTAVCVQTNSFELSAIGNDLKWYAANNNNSLLITPPVVNTTNVTTTTFYVTQTINGCESNKNQLSYTILPLPNVNIGDNETYCEGQTIELATTPNVSYQYNWNNGDTTFNSLAAQSGTFWCEVTNRCGSVRDEVDLTFVNCNQCLFVPNAFSPNGDGNNDEFKVYSNCPLSYFELQIFNRWGEKIFETYDPNKGWNGQYKSAELPAAVYVYQLILVNDLNATTSNKGSITLLR